MTGILWHARWGAGRRSVVACATFLSLIVGTTFAQSQVPSPFTEEAFARGLAAISAVGGLGNGVGLEDLDGDGDLDAIVTNADGAQVQFYENDGTGQFTLHRAGVTGVPILVGFSGLSFCDFDADGDRDIYLTSTMNSNVLLENQGGWVFVDIAPAAGVNNDGVSTGSTWGDFDGDGWVDLYLVNFVSMLPPEPFPNALYKNMGDGTFQNVAGQLGVDDPLPSFQAVFFDPDQDGDLDLYVSNDRGLSNPTTNRNELWENVAGISFNPLDNSGAEVSIDAMGIGVGDLDRNGLMDLVITNSPPGQHVPLLGTGDGLNFIDVTATSGVGSMGNGWGAIFIDYDHDGDEELWTVNSNSLNHLYDCSGGFPCTDMANALGIDDTIYSALSSRTYCTATGDIDGDGDLDLLQQSNNEPISLYINQSGSLGGSLIVDLIGLAPNTDAIGARIEVEVAGETQWRQIRAGSGYRSASPLRAHFGVGSAPLIDEVRVRWPDTSVSVLQGVAINQLLVIDQSTVATAPDCDLNMIPDTDQIAADAALDVNQDGILDNCQTLFRRGDANSDGVVDIADVVRNLGFLFSGAMVTCEQTLDANDDDAADVADPIWTLAFLFTGGPPPVAPFGTCDVDPTPLNALSCSNYPCP